MGVPYLDVSSFIIARARFIWKSQFSLSGAYNVHGAFVSFFSSCSYYVLSLCRLSNFRGGRGREGRASSISRQWCRNTIFIVKPSNLGYWEMSQNEIKNLWTGNWSQYIYLIQSGMYAALYDLPIPASLLRWIDELRDELRRRPFRWWPLVPNCGGRLELEGRLAKWQTRRLYPRRVTQTRQPLWTRTEKFHIILLRELFLLTAAHRSLCRLV